MNIMKSARNASAAILVVLLSSVLHSAGCGPSGTSEVKPLPDTSITDPENPPVTDPPSGGGSGGVPSPAPEYSTVALIFNGTGVSTSDWQTTEKIVKAQGWSYRLVNTAQMNAMSLEELDDHGVIIVPGGYGGTIYRNLTEAARLRIRRAVRDRGVGYVGFCAGAWVAVGEEAGTDETASYGFAVAEGPHLKIFWPGGDSSLVADIVKVSMYDGSFRHLVWWGGPSTPEWEGGVVARYDNGKPAISERQSGKGYVVVSGPHPEAPQGWRATAGTDPDGLDYDIAIRMMESALNRRSMMEAD